MISYENMPKICIKCKKGEDAGVEIEKFEYKRVKVKSSIASHRTQTTTSKISFPVCSSCGEQFREYQKKESFYDSAKQTLKCIIFISFCIGVGMIYYQFTRHWYGNEAFLEQIYPYIVGAIGFTISVILTIVFFYYLRITKKHPNKINQYIEMTQDGNVEIKDDDIKERLVSNIINIATEFEQDINVIFCPKCGEKYHKSKVTFCNSCGKDLRLIK